MINYHPDLGWALSYRIIHGMIRQARGLASAYQCADCDEPADAWSYDHTDPEERIDPTNRLSYGTRPKYYSPRCAPCHATFDREHRNAGNLKPPLWIRRVKAQQTEAKRRNSQTTA